ncbi:hypothetical protein N9137_03230 [Pseudomonadales bacterium]|nr:hypothetical protein [Pseudomonadales bacterium]
MSIATTIIQQMGGLGKLQAMIAARFAEKDNGVYFVFRGSRKVNYCEITIDGTDLYTMTISKRGTRKGVFYDKVVYNQSGLFSDILKPEFERVTGLYLSL